MVQSLVMLARRRPGLLTLFLLDTAITGLVARSPTTVVMCTVLFMSVTVQIVVGWRRTRPVGAP